MRARQAVISSDSVILKARCAFFRDMRREKMRGAEQRACVDAIFAMMPRVIFAMLILRFRFSLLFSIFTLFIFSLATMLLRAIITLSPLRFRHFRLIISLICMLRIITLIWLLRCRLLLLPAYAAASRFSGFATPPLYCCAMLT